MLSAHSVELVIYPEAKVDSKQHARFPSLPDSRENQNKSDTVEM